jgi:hypothetical protein
MSRSEVLSFKVATTLGAQRIVYVSGAHTVAYPSAATDAAVGVTIDTVTDTNQAIPVQVVGIAKVVLNNSINAGSLVASNNAGQGVLHVDTTAGSYVIGKALETGVTGTVIQVLIQPHFKSIP